MVDYKEEELLQKAQRGDERAITALYEEHYQAIYRYIFYRISDPETAEDLAADVFIRMIQKLPGYRDRGKPVLAWLYTIARNLVIDYYRNLGKGEQLPIQDQILPDKKAGPSEQLQDSQREECFRKALEKIPDSQRQILIFRFIEEYPTPRIMELMGKSDRAIRSLQHRALRSLEKALREEDCL